MEEQELKAYYEEKRIMEEQERKRMECGKCDNQACKATGVKLNSYGIWDVCDKCLKNFKKNKK